MPDVYLFFDTETTGLLRRGEAEPELVQLAAKLVTEDRLVRAELNVIIEPAGWKIPTEASDIHGITDEIAVKFGVPRRSALSVFSRMCKNATHAVAHNLDFDHAIISAALRREGAQNRLGDLIPICTMRAATPILKIERSPGRYKWPRLSEAYAYYVSADLFDSAHNAMADVNAMIEVFWKMKQLGHICTERSEVANAA